MVVVATEAGLQRALRGRKEEMWVWMRSGWRERRKEEWWPWGYRTGCCVGHGATDWAEERRREGLWRCGRCEAATLVLCTMHLKCLWDIWEMSMWKWGWNSLGTQLHLLSPPINNYFATKHYCYYYSVRTIKIILVFKAFLSKCSRNGGRLLHFLALEYSCKLTGLLGS